MTTLARRETHSQSAEPVVGDEQLGEVKGLLNKEPFYENFFKKE